MTALPWAGCVTDAIAFGPPSTSVSLASATAIARVADAASAPSSTVNVTVRSSVDGLSELLR